MLNQESGNRNRDKFGPSGDAPNLPQFNKNKFPGLMEAGVHGGGGGAGVDPITVLNKARELQRSTREKAVEIAIKYAKQVAEKALLSGNISLFEDINRAIDAGSRPVENDGGEITPEKLSGLNNQQFILAIRELVVPLVNGSDELAELSKVKILDRIALKVGPKKGTFKAVDLFRDNSGVPRITEKIVDGEKEGVPIQSIIESEIEARCGLRAAQLKEQDLQTMKLGAAQDAYKALITTGVVGHIGEGSLDFLSNLPTGFNQARESGDRSTLPLTRFGVDRSFQLFHLAGELVDQLENRLGGTEKNRLLIRGKEESDGLRKTIGLTDECKTEFKRKWNLKDDFIKLIEISVVKGKSFYDSGDDEAVKRQETLKKRLEKAYGTDAATLAWQMFQGFRCEGMYFSGHYLGNMVLFNQGRNFASRVLDVWGGSLHGQVAVYKRHIVLYDERGKKQEYHNLFVDSDGVPIPPEDCLKKIDLSSRGVKNDGGRWVRDYEGGGEPTDGYVVPMRNAFMRDNELKTICTAPLSQTVEVMDGDEKKKDNFYFQWSLSGTFLQKVHLGRRGRKTIEQKNSTNVTTAIDFKDSLKKVKDLGGGGEKGSKIGPAIEALTSVKRLLTDLVGAKIISNTEMREQMKIELENVLWELGVNNVLNIGGKQSLSTIAFLKPSDYNKLFEKWSVVSAGGTPLLESDQELRDLGRTVRRLIKASWLRLKGIGGINPSEDEGKLLVAEEKETKKVLPENLGDSVEDQVDIDIRRFDQGYRKLFGRK